MGVSYPGADGARRSTRSKVTIKKGRQGTLTTNKSPREPVRYSLWCRTRWSRMLRYTRSSQRCDYPRITTTRVVQREHYKKPPRESVSYSGAGEDGAACSDMEITAMELVAPVKNKMLRKTQSKAPTRHHKEHHRLQEWCVDPTVGVPAIEGRDIEFVRHMRQATLRTE
jgi:hypothetical protein